MSSPPKETQSPPAKTQSPPIENLLATVLQLTIDGEATKATRFQ